MKNAAYIIFLILFPLLSRAEILEGLAKNKNGEVVYLEKHDIKMDESGLSRFIRVEYLKSDGSVFATMVSDFAQSKVLPETTFEDSRFKTKSVLHISGNMIQFQQFKNDKVVSEKMIPVSESMVASQGFDNFIKLNFSKLESESVRFNFGVLEDEDFFSLIGYKKQSGSPDEVVFGIRSSNWFLKMFARELNVAYDKKQKKLKSYSGRSNILDDAGKSQDVFITYQWKSGS